MDIRYLENLATAKKSIDLWFSNIEQMNKGIPMFSEENSVSKEQTVFGKWYQGEGQIFSSFETFRAIQEPYDTLYDIYKEFLYLYKKPLKKSLFSNTKEKRQEELTAIFEKIRKHKDQLQELILRFEDNLKQSLLYKKTSDVETMETVSKEEAFVKKTITEHTAPKETDNKTEDTTKEKETTSVNKSTNKEKLPEIDIEEEIRRILS